MTADGTASKKPRYSFEFAHQAPCDEVVAVLDGTDRMWLTEPMREILKLAASIRGVSMLDLIKLELAERHYYAGWAHEGADEEVSGYVEDIVPSSLWPLLSPGGKKRLGEKTQTACCAFDYAFCIHREGTEPCCDEWTPWDANEQNLEVDELPSTEKQARDRLGEFLHQCGFPAAEATAIKAAFEHALSADWRELSAAAEAICRSNRERVGGQR
jgi:hypothetical protein